MLADELKDTFLGSASDPIQVALQSDRAMDV